MKLNKEQLKYLNDRITHNQQTIKDKLEDMAKRQDGGCAEVARYLKWNCEAIMYADILRNELLEVKNCLTDPNGKATLATLSDYYSGKLMSFDPSHSTSDISNIMDELEHKVHREMFKLVQLFLLFLVETKKEAK